MAHDSHPLLERFAPCLRYDSLESYFADSAEEWTANPQSRVRRTDGHAVPGPGELSLAYLGPNYPDGAPAAAEDRVECARSDYTRQYRELREARQDLRNVIYGRAVPQGGALWLQYWFFYFLNDYQLAWGIDVHEGDWEMIQLRVQGGSREPDLAVYAQHTFCEVRAWEDVRRLAHEAGADGSEPRPGDGDRPLVYVGRGSHASFFEPGFHETDFYDVTDGRQRPKRAVRLEDVTQTPRWLDWPGHWGGDATGYAGPSAPCQHVQWQDPAWLTTTAREHETSEPPDAPRLRVQRRRRTLAVDFDGSRAERALKRLTVTVNSADEPVTPPRPFRFAISEVEAGSLRTRVALAADKHYDIRVAVVDLGDRPTAAKVVLIAPRHRWLDLRRRVSGGFGRLVYRVRRLIGSDP
jgi:hypothetical protein